jgi:hypothetical protein
MCERNPSLTDRNTIAYAYSDDAPGSDIHTHPDRDANRYHYCHVPPER